MITSTDQAFAALAAYRAKSESVRIADLFAKDPNRFAGFSTRWDSFIFDYSKCALDADAMALLFDLVKKADVEGQRDAMVNGALINTTERRAVLHTAIRRSTGSVLVDGRDVMPEILTERKKMFALAEGVRKGVIQGATGEPFTDVVNLGIGGSDLGPAMATLALAPWHDGPRLHFVSNIDGAHLADTLIGLNPATTLFIIASKTFTTIETMTNAHSARRFIAEALGAEAVDAHFMAVTTALDKAAAFPVRADRITGFWDFVGGRYSIWSSIGLPLAIAIGAVRFQDFLDGAHAMDTHFIDAPVDQNIPMLLGLIGVWHRNLCGYASRALIPYDQRLARFPAYVQQLDMESNGKRVDKDGHALSRASGPIVWGEPGTNSQHAFFQLLHQGTDPVPVEFLIAAKPARADLEGHHDLLLANCLAQSEALLVGRSLEEAKAQLSARNLSQAEIERLAPHRVFPGNRPSTTLAYQTLDPATLGALIALYEHRVFVEAAIWGLNAFDQWGVELGKELATALLPLVTGTTKTQAANGSTDGLLRFLTGQR